MRGLSVALALGLVGCGGSGAAHDYNGTYRAYIHTEDKSGCGAGGELGDQQLFKLEYGTVIAVDGYKYELCTSPDACLDFGLLSLLFTDHASDGWNDDSYGATTAAGGGCTLTHTSGTLRVAKGDDVRVEWYRYAVTAPGVTDCTTQTARAMSSSLTCYDHEVLVGAKLP